MTEDDLVGRQLGEYQLEALLGQGGMARVYRAIDTRLKRYVVVKVIDSRFRHDPEYAMRFEREAQAIARLNHPNIVQLYRYDEQDGLLYMAMQFVDGADLEVVMAGYRADNEFMESDDIRRIIREVCSALDYAHSQGVIHRDVKPANILLNREGHAILTDFGLVLLTEVGTRGEIFGSAHYISPEQAISSAQVVPQSDLYAMGVILYEMVTGKVPFNADEPLDVALLHMSDPPQAPRELRPEINAELEAVILKTLDKKPEGRYPTGLALADALDRALQAKSGLATAPTLRHHTIPERVALNLGDQLLPPIPAAVAESAPAPVEESISGSIPPTAPPAKMKTWTYIGVVFGIGILGLIALVCLGSLFLPAVMSRFKQGGSTVESQATATKVSQLLTAPVDLLPAPSATQTESVTGAIPSPAVSPTQLPSPTAVSFVLNIVRDSGHNSIFVQNQSGGPFPLELLSLIGDKNKGVTGTAWGVTNLAGGACVGVWKEDKKKNYVLPGGLNCNGDVNTFIQKNKDWFGDATVEVFYNGISFGKCSKDQSLCSITIVP